MFRRAPECVRLPGFKLSLSLSVSLTTALGCFAHSQLPELPERRRRKWKLPTGFLEARCSTTKLYTRTYTPYEHTRFSATDPRVQYKSLDTLWDRPRNPTFLLLPTHRREGAMNQLLVFRSIVIALLFQHGCGLVCTHSSSPGLVQSRVKRSLPELGGCLRLRGGGGDYSNTPSPAKPIPQPKLIASPSLFDVLKNKQKTQETQTINFKLDRVETQQELVNYKLDRVQNQINKRLDSVQKDMSRELAIKNFDGLQMQLNLMILFGAMQGTATAIGTTPMGQHLASSVGSFTADVSRRVSKMFRRRRKPCPKKFQAEVESRLSGPTVVLTSVGVLVFIVTILRWGYMLASYFASFFLF